GPTWSSTSCRRPWEIPPGVRARSHRSAAAITRRAHAARACRTSIRDLTVARGGTSRRNYGMDLRPMLATLADAPLADKNLVYEPKYDGIRALVEITPGRGMPDVRIWSRNGNDKTTQFPSIVEALSSAATTLKGRVTLDGEIVALHADGRPAGFQRLQGRIHLTGASDVERVDRDQPVALIAFDLLRDGADDLCKLPLTERRKRLE